MIVTKLVDQAGECDFLVRCGWRQASSAVGLDTLLAASHECTMKPGESSHDAPKVFVFNTLAVHKGTIMLLSTIVFVLLFAPEYGSGVSMITRTRYLLGAFQSRLQMPASS